MSLKKTYQDLPYRWKLLLIIVTLVLVVVVLFSGMMILTGARQSSDSSLETLELYTEQTLTHFIASVRTAERSIHAQYMASGAPSQLQPFSRLKSDTPEYLVAVRELTGSLSRMVGAGTFFDHATLRMDESGVCVDSDNLDEWAVTDARTLFSQEKYARNTYNQCLWSRLPDGSLWVVRDIYHPNPLKHLAKVAMRVRQDTLIPVSGSDSRYQGQVLLYDREGLLLTAADPESPLVQQADGLIKSGGPEWHTETGHYAVSVLTEEGYTAVGLLPISVVRAVRTSVLQNTLLAALLGILLGVVSAWAISHRLTRQLNSLVGSMKEVADGHLDVLLPVESHDEVGELAEHFNTMTMKTRELLERLVKEEQNKQQAEYQNLEYQYRFLQWQVNPHFIYNALEVVNAMAKIDGDDELSRIIIELSAYFRQNARSSQRRYVTVSEEFASLSHYAEIYRRIYLTPDEVTFDTGGEAGRAYVPTMILQPLLENALVHGRCADGAARIEVTAGQNGSRLVIQLRDHGPGLNREAIDLLLASDQPDGSKDHLGIRNVQARLRLLYADQASLSIDCPPEGGTLMRMEMPVSFELPKDQLLHQ